MTPKAQSIRGKSDKFRLSEINFVIFANGPSKRMKGQAIDLEKKKLIPIFYKRLLSRTHKEFPNFKSKRKKNPIREWSKGRNKHFTEEDIQYRWKIIT